MAADLFWNNPDRDLADSREVRWRRRGADPYRDVDVRGGCVFAEQDEIEGDVRVSGRLPAVDRPGEQEVAGAGGDARGRVTSTIEDRRAARQTLPARRSNDERTPALGEGRHGQRAH